MFRFFITFTFFLTIFTLPGLSGVGIDIYKNRDLNIAGQDTVQEIQTLFNGRLWRNRYYKVKEDQFLFSREFLPGSVTIDGKSFNNISVRYDIYNDEIMTVTNHGAILQLNKEMVDSFNIIFENKPYYFTKMAEDSLKGFKGFMNVLYKGKTALYVKYKKEIELLAVEKKFDLFYQIHRIYFVKDNLVHLINTKRELLNLLGDYKLQIKGFIKKSKLKVTKKEPESFIPVVKFYESLSH